VDAGGAEDGDHEEDEHQERAQMWRDGGFVNPRGQPPRGDAVRCHRCFPPGKSARAETARARTAGAEPSVTFKLVRAPRRGEDDRWNWDNRRESAGHNPHGLKLSQVGGVTGSQPRTRAGLRARARAGRSSWARRAWSIARRGSLDAAPRAPGLAPGSAAWGEGPTAGRVSRAGGARAQNHPRSPRVAQ